MLVAMESIHLVAPWLDDSFQKFAEGIRGEGFVNDRNLASERRECSDSCAPDGYSCNVQHGV